MKLKLVVSALACAGVVSITGCGGGGGGGSADAGPPPVAATTTMTVSPALGRFRNGASGNDVKVSVYQNGAKLGTVAWNNTTGKAIVSGLTGAETNLVVEVEGGEYFDEAEPTTPKSFAGKKLRTVVEKPYLDVAVTPLTNAAAQRLIDVDAAGTPKLKAGKGANDILGENLKEGQRFGLGNAVVPPVLVDATNKVRSDDAVEAQRHAIVLAALAEAGKRKGKNPAEVAEKLAEDLADGKLDDNSGSHYTLADVTTGFAATATTVVAAIAAPTYTNLATLTPTIKPLVTDDDVKATVAAVTAAGDAIGQARTLFSALRSGILPYANHAGTGYTQTELAALQTSLNGLTSATLGLDLQMRAIGEATSFLLKRMTTPDSQLRSTATTLVNGVPTTTPLQVVDADGATVAYKVMDIRYRPGFDEGKIRCVDDAGSIARKGYLSNPSVPTSAVVKDGYPADTTNAIFCTVFGAEIWNAARTEFYRPVFIAYTSNPKEAIGATSGTVAVNWASRYNRFAFNNTFDPWGAPNGTLLERGVGSAHTHPAFPGNLLVEDPTQKNRRNGSFTVAATFSQSPPVAGKMTRTVSGQLTNVQGLLWPVLNAGAVNTTDKTEVSLTASIQLKLTVDAATGQEVGTSGGTGNLSGTVVAKAATTPGDAASVVEIARLGVAPADGAANLVAFDEAAIANAAAGLKVVFSLPGKHEIAGQVSVAGLTQKSSTFQFPQYVGVGGTHNWNTSCFSFDVNCLVPAVPALTGQYVIGTRTVSEMLPNAASFSGTVKNLATGVVVFDGAFNATGIGYANFDPTQPSSAANFVTGTATLTGTLKKSTTDPGLKLTLVATRPLTAPETYSLSYVDGNSNLTIQASWIGGAVSGKVTNSLSAGVEVVWNKAGATETWKVQKGDATPIGTLTDGFIRYVDGYVESII